MTILTKRQYCVVVDPVGKDKKSQLGLRQLRRGPCTFFLHPGECIHPPPLPQACCAESICYIFISSLPSSSAGERLEKGIQDSIVLEADECLVVTAQEEFVETLPDGRGRTGNPLTKRVDSGTTGAHNTQHTDRD